MFKISFQNSAGELVSATAESGEKAVTALIELLQQVPELYDGDKIIITED